MGLQIGDRVKLTTKAAATANRDRRGRGKDTDWSKREGKVVRPPKFNRSVSILWDGTNFIDEWPVAAIEKVI